MFDRMKLIVLLAPFLITTGCALNSNAKNPTTPLSTTAQGQLGHIALVWEGAQSSFDYGDPTSKEENAGKVLSAATGGLVVAGGAFWYGAAQGSASDGDDLKVLGAVAGAIGVVAAAPTMLRGATDFAGSESTLKLSSAKAAMQRAADGLDFGDELCRRLQDSIHTQTSFRVTPASVPELDRTLERPTLQNIYRSLGSQGFDTVIKINPLASLDGEKRFTLRADVWVTVVDITTGQELYWHKFHFQSKRRKFSDWAKNDAQPFRDVLEHCYVQLTDDITRQLFPVH
jgi:hypothetical protein